MAASEMGGKGAVIDLVQVRAIAIEAARCDGTASLWAGLVALRQLRIYVVVCLSAYVPVYLSMRLFVCVFMGLNLSARRVWFSGYVRARAYGWVREGADIGGGLERRVGAAGAQAICGAAVGSDRRDPGAGRARV